jgi:hypothetical protein
LPIDFMQLIIEVANPSRGLAINLLTSFNTILKESETFTCGQIPRTMGLCR